MTNEERVACIQRGENKAEHLEQLYYSNMPLWVSVLRPYVGLCELEDLKQQAFLSVMEAVKRYEPERGSFIHFACLLIAQDVPVYLLSCGNGLSAPAWLNKRKERYLQLIEQGVTDREEIARRLNISAEAVRVLAVALGDVVSLDAETEAGSLGDVVASGEDIESSVVDRVGAEQLRGQVWKEVEDKLSGRRLEIIQALFIAGESVASLADRFGVSVQRIAQLKESALIRLRDSEKLGELAFDYEYISCYAWRSGVRLWKRTGTSCEERYVIELEKLEKEERKQVKRIYNEKAWKKLLDYVARVRGA